MDSRKFLTTFLVIAVFALLSGSALGETQQVQKEDKAFLEQIIDLVVKNNPALQSQREFIDEIQKMPQPGEGIIDEEEFKSNEGEAPLLSLTELENLRKMRVERKKTLSQAKQTYESLKKSLLSELLTNITKISQLKNRQENLHKLKSFLEERKVSLEKQVKAGVEEPSALFDLTERIMEISLEIQNVEKEVEILKLETAVNFGGEKWQELLDLLDKI